jgi:hypothetical protein
VYKRQHWNLMIHAYHATSEHFKRLDTTGKLG